MSFENDEREVGKNLKLLCAISIIIGVSLLLISTIGINKEKEFDTTQPWLFANTHEGTVEDVQWMIDDTDDVHLYFVDGTYFRFVNYDAYSELHDHIGEEVKIWYEYDMYYHMELL